VPVTVDLVARTVTAGEGDDRIEDSFDVDDYTRWRLLQGLDDIGLTLVARVRHIGVRGTAPALETGDASGAHGRLSRSADGPKNLSARRVRVRGR
jgi:hypothetical protein